MTITSENEKIVDKAGGTRSLSVSIHVMIWSTSWPTLPQEAYQCSKG
jgi:hypothetical protein